MEKNVLLRCYICKIKLNAAKEHKDLLFPRYYKYPT